MTTNNPDPLEEDIARTLSCHLWATIVADNNDDCDEFDAMPDYIKDIYRRAAAAIIAQHYAPVIAENERLRNTCEAPEAAAMRYIEALRSNYGSVTILPDNEDADYRDQQTAIDCCGEWTNWQDQRFYGETVLQCLAKAIGVMNRTQTLGAKP